MCTRFRNRAQLVKEMEWVAKLSVIEKLPFDVLFQCLSCTTDAAAHVFCSFSPAFLIPVRLSTFQISTATLGLRFASRIGVIRYFDNVTLTRRCAKYNKEINRQTIWIVAPAEARRNET